MSRFSRFLLVPLAAVAFDLGSLPAQVEGQPIRPPTTIDRPGVVPTIIRPGASPTTELAGPPKDAGPRLNFEFDDLPLEEVIKRVQASYRQESGKFLNVMVPQQMRDVARTNLINLDVRQVTVGELFDLLGRASQQNVEIHQDWGRGSTQFSRMTTGYKFEPVSAGGDNLTFLLKGEYPPERPWSTVNNPANVEDPKFVQFYQLDPYLDRFTVEDITTAIKTGADLAGYRGEPTMKFHGETKLLVVHGTQRQIGMVQEVLQSLANAKRPPGQPVPSGLGRPGQPQPVVHPPQPVLPPQPLKP